MLIQVFLSGVLDYAKQVAVNIHFKNPIFHPNKQDTNRLEFCPARVSIFQLSSLDLSVGWTMDCQALLCHRVINQLMHIYCLLLEKKIENDNVKPTYLFFVVLGSFARARTHLNTSRISPSSSPLMLSHVFGPQLH